MDQMTAEQLAIIEKVKKLMALANNNDNEHQAAAASAKAMELLASYNLDMATVGKTAKGVQGARKDNKLKGGLYGWQRELWKAVSELNFCMYWSIKGLARGSTYEHRILGSEVNVVSAQVMAEYLQSTVERLAREYAKTAFPGQSIFIKEMIAYREGLATRLSERLRQLRRDRVAEDERKKREAAATARHPGSAGGTGLILMDVIYSEEDANYDHLYGYPPAPWQSTAQRVKLAAQLRQPPLTPRWPNVTAKNSPTPTSRQPASRGRRRKPRKCTLGGPRRTRSRLIASPAIAT